MVIELKDQKEFDGLLKNGNVLLKFEASWCGPCKVLNRIIDSIANNIDVNFIRVDVDEFPELAQKYLVSSIPTCFAYKDGKSISFKNNGNDELSLLGAMDEDSFVKVLKDTFSL